MAANCLVDGKRSPRNMIADPPDRDPGCDAGTVPRAAAAGAMIAINAILPAPVEDGMLGNDSSEVEDTDQVWQLLNLDDTTGAIGHAVVVPANGDETIVT